ncbi:hypothetical protein AB0B94_30915 [Micromonospora sp. NPDC048986]|uniref:hypothetical protein n=1 Tax=Micromonospora sp. NPDC048986 TaxID=3155644 RepID=UPI0033C901B7
MSTIEINGRVYDRDQLATAVLVRMDNPDAAVTADLLMTEHGMSSGLAGELASVAKLCITRNLEP